MTESVTHLATTLAERFSDVLISCVTDRDETTLVIPAEHLLSVCGVLRDDALFAFTQLSDLCGVDYSTYGQVDWATNEATTTGFSRGRSANTPQHSANVDDNAVDDHAVDQRFAVVYHLLSIQHNTRLRLRCYLTGEHPRIASVVNIWCSADWFEREAFDLFGILFEGHPDLRRLLTDYGFIGHPFRKDFPLEGNVEVRYDPDKKRVVYQPVTITNRVLVPRVIRDDTRHVAAKEDQSDA